MLAEIDADQLREWMEYWEAEPFGDEWRQNALSCYTTYAVQPGKKKRQLTPDAWMPTKPRKKKQTWQQMKAVLDAATKGHNARQSHQQPECLAGD